MNEIIKEYKEKYTNDEFPNIEDVIEAVYERGNKDGKLSVLSEIEQLLRIEKSNDVHKKDVQTCPTSVLERRQSYNAGLLNGFINSILIVSSKRNELE